MLPLPCVIDLFTILEVWWSDDPIARVSILQDPSIGQLFPYRECGRRTRLND